MNKETRNRIEYTVICISEFAQKHRIPSKDAYRYLKEYGGLAFLKDCYDAEHLLSVDDAIDDLTIVCKRNGGKIACSCTTGAIPILKRSISKIARPPRTSARDFTPLPYSIKLVPWQYAKAEYMAASRV